MSAPKRRTVALPTSGTLPRVGKIRLGEQRPTGKTNQHGEAITRPAALDYFRVDSDEAGVTSQSAAAAFAEAYPGQPRELRCLLPGRKAQDVMEGAWRLYGARKLKRKCDGAFCDERTTTGGWVEKPCLCAGAGGTEIPVQITNNKGDLVANPAHCKLTYTIQVLLPEVAAAGVWQIETGSIISAGRMADFLAFAETLVGDLALLEFTLRLVPVDVAPDGKAKKVYVLDAEIQRASIQALLAGEGRARRQLPPPAEMAALPAPADEDADPLLHGDDGDSGDYSDDPPEPSLEDRGRALVEALKVEYDDLAEKVIDAACYDEAGGKWERVPDAIPGIRERLEAKRIALAAEEAVSDEAGAPA